MEEYDRIAINISAQIYVVEARLKVPLQNIMAGISLGLIPKK